MTVQTFYHDEIMKHDNNENNCIHINQARNFEKLANAGLLTFNSYIFLPCFFNAMLTQSENNADITRGDVIQHMETLLCNDSDRLKNFIQATKATLFSLEICIGSKESKHHSELQLTDRKVISISCLSVLYDNILEVLADLSESSYKDFTISANLTPIPYYNCRNSGTALSRDRDSGFQSVITLLAYIGFSHNIDINPFNADEFHISKQALTIKKNAIIQRKLGHKSQACELKEDGTLIFTALDKRTQLKFCVSDQQAESIASITIACENILNQAVQIFWHINDCDGGIGISDIQTLTTLRRPNNLLERYLVKEKGHILTEGRSIGQRIASGPIRIITHRKDIGLLKEGEILVTDMTDPDWESVIDKASAIITNRGGRTCHAAIIARELGVPAIVGCIDATQALSSEKEVTVSCAEGDTGYVYQGLLDYAVSDQEIFNTPQLDVGILMNVGNPDRAYQFQSYPNNGVGLARLEFIINRMIGIHPKALLNSHKLSVETQSAINIRIAGYNNPVDFFKAKLMEGVATIAAAFYPKKVVVRLSDFKSNEYSHLIGGSHYEPTEENPMLGFRGVSRYLSEDFMPCFKLECQALKAVREEMGFTNIELMVPFCRTIGEAKQVVELLSENGLVRGENGLKIIMMCEIPANALLAEQFLEHFDGFSIGSNDLTQLTLGLDRDSALVAHLFDERNEAVKALFSMAINACKKAGKSIGVCGQAPSEHPDLAQWLLEQGVESLSLDPDAVLETLMHLNKK